MSARSRNRYIDRHVLPSIFYKAVTNGPKDSRQSRDTTRVDRSTISFATSSLGMQLPRVHVAREAHCANQFRKTVSAIIDRRRKNQRKKPIEIKFN